MNLEEAEVVVVERIIMDVAGLVLVQRRDESEDTNPCANRIYFSSIHDNSFLRVIIWTL